jgi:hypothetical protein
MTAAIPQLWVHSLHNLHCPTCDERLLQRARRFFVPERAAHYVVGEVGTLACPHRHPLPEREALYVYRAERGNAEDAPVAAVDGAG